MASTSTDLPFALYHAHKRRLELLAVRHACPKGLYVSGSANDDPLQWQGVLFVRQGVYASGIFRFNITFPAQYPALPPSILFTTDVFHPLVTPTSTYRHAAPDSDLGTRGAADQSRSPPGTLNLRHGFPHWPEDVATSPVPILRVLYYLRAVFVHATMLDSIAFDDAANTSAWHAYQAFRNDVPMQLIHHRDGRVQESLAALDGLRLASGPSSRSAQSQPGGARTPDQWSWNGVWEERLAKTIQQSSADRVLYADDPELNNMINFVEIDSNMLELVRLPELT